MLTDFDPVPLRYRVDGLTPQKQRDFVEALADCGIAREAAARIGVSEQAIARVRRRADARAFDLACEAAQQIGARRLRSIAWERAIEGTVRRHYYHGELKSEEVVFDNRLLVYLLGQTAAHIEPPAEAQAVVEDWDRWMDAIEQGLPPPLPAPAADPAAQDADEADDADEDDEDGDADDEDEEAFTGGEVWEEEDGWWTHFPPPAGFDGEEEGEPGGYHYKRTLTEAELAAVEAENAEEQAETLARQSARRDLYFGFSGDAPGAEEAAVFPPREAETYGTSVQLPPDLPRADEAGGGAPEGPLERPHVPPDGPPKPSTGPRIRRL